MIAAVLIALLAGAPARAMSFQALSARAARRARDGRAAAAIADYRAALAAWREDDGARPRARAQCALADLLADAGRRGEALRDYDACLKIERRDARAFDHRGRLLLLLGRAQAALDDFYKSVALDMNYAPAYLDRARAYERRGDKVFAREDYRRACDLGLKSACAKIARSRRAGKGSRPRASAAALTAACRRAAEACVRDGSTYGDCLARAPRCSADSTGGCCPGSCADAMRRALDDGLSDAAAFRRVFDAAACAATN